MLKTVSSFHDAYTSSHPEKKTNGLSNGKSAEQRLQADQNNFCCTTQDTYFIEHLRERERERGNTLAHTPAQVI